jgi:hypothetical protein
LTKFLKQERRLAVLSWEQASSSLVRVCSEAIAKLGIAAMRAITDSFREFVHLLEPEHVVEIDFPQECDSIVNQIAAQKISSLVLPKGLSPDKHAAATLKIEDALTILESLAACRT